MSTAMSFQSHGFGPRQHLTSRPYEAHPSHSDRPNSRHNYRHLRPMHRNTLGPGPALTDGYSYMSLPRRP